VEHDDDSTNQGRYTDGADYRRSSKPCGSRSSRSANSERCSRYGTTYSGSAADRSTTAGGAA
jgi:hypothetical protein